VGGRGRQSLTLLLS